MHSSFITLPSQPPPPRPRNTTCCPVTVTSSSSPSHELTGHLIARYSHHPKQGETAKRCASHELVSYLRLVIVTPAGKQAMLGYSCHFRVSILSPCVCVSCGSTVAPHASPEYVVTSVHDLYHDRRVGKSLSDVIVMLLHFLGFVRERERE